MFCVFGIFLLFSFLFFCFAFRADRGERVAWLLFLTAHEGSHGAHREHRTRQGQGRSQLHWGNYLSICPEGNSIILIKWVLSLCTWQKATVSFLSNECCRSARDRRQQYHSYQMSVVALHVTEGNSIILIKWVLSLCTWQKATVSFLSNECCRSARDRRQQYHSYQMSVVALHVTEGNSIILIKWVLSLCTWQKATVSFLSNECCRSARDRRQQYHSYQMSVVALHVTEGNSIILIKWVLSLCTWQKATVSFLSNECCRSARDRRQQYHSYQMSVVALHVTEGNSIILIKWVLSLCTWQKATVSFLSNECCRSARDFAPEHFEVKYHKK